MLELLKAERDGLLTYVGYTSGDRYEIVVIEESVDVHRDEVGTTVDRLRLVKQLADDGADIRLVAVTADSYVLDVAGRRRTMPVGGVGDWLGGYGAASRAVGQKHVGEDQLGQIRPVMVAPTLSDQFRLVILGQMHAGEQRMPASELAERVGTTKKTVIKALSLGRDSLDMGLAAGMMRVFGLRWSATSDALEVYRGEGDQVAEDLPELPGIRWLRQIVEASDRGLVRYVGEPGVNKARWADRFDLAVGEHTYTVPGVGLSAWLEGLAAFQPRRSARRRR
ncbi:hypothetical protein AB0F93_03625 [Micromonospora tulbaghiae]|uniref:hypothetical protein n=1 Tax=Micromonospora tulbaghiae TaxID=479978 RepID=UPI00332D4940